MFKVNNKNTRTTSPCRGITFSKAAGFTYSTVDSEQINVNWEDASLSS